MSQRRLAQSGRLAVRSGKTIRRPRVQGAFRSRAVDCVGIRIRALHSATGLPGGRVNQLGCVLDQPIVAAVMPTRPQKVAGKKKGDRGNAESLKWLGAQVLR